MAFDQYEVLSSFLSTKSLSDALQTLTTQQTQETYIKEMTVVCTTAVDGLATLPFDPIPAVSVLVSLSLMNSIAAQCSLAAPSLVAGLQTAVDNLKAAVISQPDMSTIIGQQPANFSSLEESVNSGNTSAAISYANDILNDANFLGVTQNLGGGFT